MRMYVSGNTGGYAKTPRLRVETADGKEKNMRRIAPEHSTLVHPIFTCEPRNMPYHLTSGSHEKHPGVANM